MIKTEEVVIDGIKFSTTQLPAMRAYPLLVRLIKVIGPALGALAQLPKDAELTAALPQLIGAMSSLEPAEAEKIATDVLALTTATVPDAAGRLSLVTLSTPAAIDSVFTGSVLLLFKVMWHAIRVNFQDFFGGPSLTAGAAPAQSPGTKPPAA